MDMVEVLILLLRAEVIKMKVDIGDLPDGFFARLESALEDNVLNGPELADIIEAFRGK